MKKPLSLEVLRALALAALAGAAPGCSNGGTPTQASQLPGTITTSPVTAGADNPLPLGLQLEAVRQATARFHDVAAAVAAGYRAGDPNEPCIASPAGVMGIHAPNLALMGDQALDPLRPELLLYAPTPEGGHRLVGVEYFQAVLLRNPATNEVGPWLDLEPWPPEYEVVTPTPVLFGEAFQGPMPPHVGGMPWHWDLHVWIWTPNPSGTFAEWNPDLRCE